jgi:hypothetical protein
LQVAGQLLSTNRISREERSHVFSTLEAARAGQSLPVPPVPGPFDIVDRGHEFDAAGALSLLFPQIDPDDRRELFSSALQRANGAFPAWYEDILYPDMLLKLPSELQADLLLEVDIKGLAGWSSLQPVAWQTSFLGGLAPSIQSAVRASMSFSSRADQLQMARQGRHELVFALKRLVARGKVSFAEIVA